MHDLAVSPLDIERAARTIKSYTVRTPLIENPVLNGIAGGRVLLKAENLQRTGSFKFRGAFNALSNLSVDDKRAGVFAISSGNHAQGVAEAARLLDIAATILMPSDAPRLKRERTERSGAAVVTFDRATAPRDEVVARYQAEHQSVFVAPFDNPHVIAGQGTAGLEMAEDLIAMDIRPDAAIVCCGGGGLSAGVATALAAHFPDIEIVTSEPVGFDDFARSLETGEPQENAALAGSIQDAIITVAPGKLTFPILKHLRAHGVRVSDEEALDAMAFAYRELKLVLEPGGAAALAAVLNKRVDMKERTVLVVLSGGNVDADVFARAIS